MESVLNIATALSVMRVDCRPMALASEVTMFAVVSAHWLRSTETPIWPTFVRMARVCWIWCFSVICYSPYSYWLTAVAAKVTAPT